MDKLDIIKMVVVLLLLIGMVFGSAFIGGFGMCNNGGGVLAGNKCINTEQLIPVITPEGKTVYVTEDTALPEGFEVLQDE